MAGRKHATLAMLPNLALAELKQEWARLYGVPAPKISAPLLRLGLGYRMQEQKLGGLSREAKSMLRAAGKQSELQPNALKVPRKLTPGTRLVRDWHGTGHTVTVLEKGFEYDGKQWRSLSAIAKAITGTHWNGPLFFGLTGRSA